MAASIAESTRKGNTHNQTLHAAHPRIAGRPQPQGLAYARPAECPQLAPREDQDEHELPDEPRRKQKEQSLR
jgi:hypothetical protein